MQKGKIVQGKIKWFSQEKGYGYIVGEDSKEYYFNIRDIQGADLPTNGDIVSFESGQGQKGPRASSVLITAKAQSSPSRGSDDRVSCPHCGKKMIPRLIVSNGNPKKSVCPFCAGTYKSFGCFIATAVYGDHYAPEVIALRRFRDESLETKFLGRIFVKIYYLISPSIARFLTKNPRLSNIIKPALSLLAKKNS